MEQLICDFLCPVRVHNDGCNRSGISGAVVTVQRELNSVVCLSQINLIPGEDDSILFDRLDVHRVSPRSGGCLRAESMARSTELYHRS